MGRGRKNPFGVEVRRLSGGACKEESGVYQGVLVVEENSLLFAFPAVLEIDGKGDRYHLHRAVCCSEYPWHSRRTNKQAGESPPSGGSAAGYLDFGLGVFFKSILREGRKGKLCCGRARGRDCWILSSPSPARAMTLEGPRVADAAPCSQPSGDQDPVAAAHQVCSPSPRAGCLVPFLLAELLFEPLRFPPARGFPGCGELASNAFRRFQRQESDPRLLCWPWESGCCAMGAHACALSRAAAVPPVRGQLTRKQVRYQSTALARLWGRRAASPPAERKRKRCPEHGSSSAPRVQRRFGLAVRKTCRKRVTPQSKCHPKGDRKGHQREGVRVLPAGGEQACWGRGVLPTHIPISARPPATRFFSWLSQPSAVPWGSGPEHPHAP